MIRCISLLILIFYNCNIHGGVRPLPIFNFNSEIAPIDIIFNDAIPNGPNAVILPFKYYQSLILITATVDGETGDFIIDTGASKMVLNSKYFEFRNRQIVNAYGVGGNLEEMGTSKIQNFIAEELTIKNIRTDVINLDAIEEKKNTKILGLIGFDVLESFEIQFNYHERFITLTKIDKEGNRIETPVHTFERLDSFPINIGNYIPLLEVIIDGETKLMGLDTGAEYNLLDIKRNKKRLASFDIKGRVSITGADGNDVEALGGILYKVALNEKFKCGGMATLLTNLDNLDKIYGTDLDGILGNAFFAPWITSINYRKKLLYIHPLKYMKP